VRGLARTKTLRPSDGLVLIEVLIAMVLLGLLVVPLVSGVQSATGRADAVRSQAAQVRNPPQTADSGDAWEWGTTVLSAWWQPGPILTVQTVETAGEEQIAGLWVDGWFLGEHEPEGDGTVRVEAPVWYGHIGDELVVRVRAAAGTWGPPWRLVVAAADGGSTSAVLVDDGAGGDTVAHVPALANPALQVPWADTAVEASPPGLPFLFPCPGTGTCVVDLDGREQLWKTEAGRGLDIYF